MTYNFKKFERDSLRGASQISISRASALRFSAKFCRETNITSFEYVIIFYDKAKNAIGILPANEKEKGVFKITKEATSASVSISSFMNAHNLDPEIYHGPYKWTRELVPNIGEVYIIMLDHKNEANSR